MFYDRPDCIKLAEKIFVIKNAVPKELVDSYVEQLSVAPREDFKYEESLINWYVDKVSPYIHGIHDIWEKISDVLYPEYVIHPSLNVLTVRPGDGGMFIHSDSPGRGCEMHLTQLDEWSTCCIIDYGLVFYMGEWTGGAIFYPNINPDGTVKQDGDSREGACLEYMPEPGDIVIHSSTNPYEHGVREVESGIRYAYSNFVLKAEENPGTFYNYKTTEYYAQIGDRGREAILDNWARPFYTSETVIRLKKEHGITVD
jgi:hypothetical protein